MRSVTWPDPVTIEKQGRVIAEEDEGGFFVMFPDGNVTWVATKRAAEREGRQWFKDNLGSAQVGIGEIIWRD